MSSFKITNHLADDHPHGDAPVSPLRLSGSVRTPMVLHVRTVAGAGGGPDKTILRSAQYCDPDHIRMAAAYIHPSHGKNIQIIKDQAKQYHCPLFLIPEFGPLDPRTIVRLIAICRRERVTVWHSHDYKTDILGLIIRRFWPMKLITTAHGFTRESWRTKVYYHLNNLAFRRLDHVITVSPQLLVHCKRHGVSADRVTFVPNAIDPEEFIRTRKREQACADHDVDPARFHIGVVGRLSKEKGIDRAVRTAARLKRNYDRLQMHFIGDGPLRGDTERAIERLNVDRHVKLWGWQESPRPFYEMFDMLLLPSYTEGLPNAVLEAMAMGVPVAATDVGGVRDLLNWGNCGVILDNDEALWPNHIAPLIVSEARRNELARQARQRVESHYTFKSRMKKVIAVYEDLLRIRRKDKAAIRMAA